MGVAISEEEWVKAEIGSLCAKIPGGRGQNYLEHSFVLLRVFAVVTNANVQVI